MSPTKGIYIAVIGHKGVGKSEFIGLCTGEETGARSIFHPWTTWSGYTNQIQAWSFTHQGQRIILIDTPGVDGIDIDRDYDDLETWLKNQGRVDQKGVELDGVIFLLSVAEDPVTRVWNQDFHFVERCCNKNPLSRTILAKTGWDSVSHKEGFRHESDLKRIAQSISKTRFDDSNSVRLYFHKHSCLATLDMLLQEINSDIQERRDEQTAKHRKLITASKETTASSKKAQATDEAEEKTNRSGHAAATEYEEEITALKQQILNLEKANQALSAENERSHAALAASITQAAATQDYENQIEALTTALDEKTKEVTAMKAYIAEAERTATGYWGDVEIPPIPYSLEPPRQAND